MLQDLSRSAIDPSHHCPPELKPPVTMKQNRYELEAVVMQQQQMTTTTTSLG